MNLKCAGYSGLSLLCGVLFVATVGWNHSSLSESTLQNPVVSLGDEDDVWTKGNLLKDSSSDEWALLAGKQKQTNAQWLPNTWNAVLPNPHIAPSFALEPARSYGQHVTHAASTKAAGGRYFLAAAGNGVDEKSFGYVFQAFNLNPHREYTFRVRFKLSDDIAPHNVHRHVVHALVGSSNLMITNYTRRVDGWMEGSVTFDGPHVRSYCECRLYFKYSKFGKVWWDRIAVTEKVKEISMSSERLVRIATVWGIGNFSWWGAVLDEIGRTPGGVDVTLLPEFMNAKDPRHAEDIDHGETFQFLSRKAAEWNMYVATSIYERRGNLVYNSAPLYDRKGKLVGLYEKNHLYEPELEAGASPGDTLKVFTTDFGRVGFVTCYDSWFPELFRWMSLQGAEIILFPSVSFFFSLMYARAADYGLVIAAAAQGTTSGVWDCGGVFSDEFHNPLKAGDATRRAPTSIVHNVRNTQYHFSVTTVDLKKRYSPHWYGTGEGPFRSAPGGRDVRNTALRPQKYYWDILRTLRPADTNHSCYDVDNNNDAKGGS